ncbi:hypothetical protein BH09BAC6_BH09BAC6_08370 [soil metagenome]|jgi:hypothetical protein
MRKYCFIFICIASGLSCHSNQTVKDSDSSQVKQSKASIPPVKIEDSKTIDKIAGGENEKSIRARMIGIWGSGGSDNAVFKISKTKFYYTEHFEYYAYKISGDSVTISYPDFDETFKVSFISRDTLILSNRESEKSIFYRFKKSAITSTEPNNLNQIKTPTVQKTPSEGRFRAGLA